MTLRNLFLKTIRDLRGQVLGWGIGLGLVGLMVILLFPSFKDQMGSLLTLLESYPPALTGFFGDMTQMATFPGWLNVEFYSYAPPILAIFAVSAGTGLIAGEEERGTLDLLLSQPIPRWRVVAEKFAALVVATLLIALIVAVLFIGSAMAIGETTDLGRIALATANLVPVTLASGALALMASVLFRSRRLATAVTLVIVIGSFFLESLGKTLEVLEPYRPIALYHYYDSSGVLLDRANWTDPAILLGLALLFFVGAIVAFERRDIAV